MTASVVASRQPPAPAGSDRLCSSQPATARHNTHQLKRRQTSSAYTAFIEPERKAALPPNERPGLNHHFDGQHNLIEKQAISFECRSTRLIDFTLWRATCYRIFDLSEKKIKWRNGATPINFSQCSLGLHKEYKKKQKKNRSNLHKPIFKTTEQVFCQ